LYEPLDRDRPDVARLYGQVCAQINHLSYNRTDDDSKKVGARERKELISLIHDEAVRLGKDLRAGYDKRYLMLDRLASAAGMVINLASVATTSSLAASFSTTINRPAGYTGRAQGGA
jgi:hypothetical protein